MPAFLVWSAIYLGGTLLANRLRPRPKNPAKRGDLKDFEAPTIDQNQPPVRIYGTVKLESPVLGWWGDLKSAQVRDEGYPVGYRYYMGSQHAFCAGPDVELVEFHFDGKKRPIKSTEQMSDHVRFTIDMNGTREIKGTPTVEECTARFYPGSPTQQPDPYLAAQLTMPGVPAGTIPAWRGISYLVMGDTSGPGVILDPHPGGNRFYAGDQTTAKRIAAVLRRFPNGLGLSSNHHRIGTDANPACMIYDELTAPKTPYDGAGGSPAEIDLTALRALGEACHTEGLGLSMSFQGGSVESRIREILRHIDATWYVDQRTGLHTFKLIRDDYDPEDVPAFGPSSLKDFTQRYSDQTLANNTVRVTYRDIAAGFIERPAARQNIAAVEVAGGVRADEISLPGISNATTAQKTVDRLLRSQGPLVPVSGFVRRGGAVLRPGGVIRIDWPPEGVYNLLVRITQLRLGPEERGDVYFEGIQDVFGASLTTYGAPPDTAWAPVQSAAALASQNLIEAPPYLRGYYLKDSETDPTGILMAARGAGAQDGFHINVLDDDSTYRRVDSSGVFAPRGQLVDIATETSSYLVVRDLQDVATVREASEADWNAGRNVLLVGGELIAFRALTYNGDGTYTVTGLARGCVDTIPESHAPGDAVWFLTDGLVRTPLNAPVGSQVNRQTTIKLQPFNAVGARDIALCAASSVVVTTTPRHLMPGGPCRVLVGSQRYPSSIPGGLSVSWVHRNRLARGPYGFSNGTTSPEPGTVYSVRVYGESGTLVHAEDNLTGILWGYPTATEISESGLGRLNHGLRVKLWAVRAGVPSWSTFDWTFTRP